MIVFDIIVDKHPEATAPDFSKQYKKQETIEKKAQEWLEEGGWKEDPANCVITSFLMADPTNPEKDKELPATENSVIQFVEHIVDDSRVVVADDFTHKTCVLANTISGMISKLEADPKEDDASVLSDLRQALADLYRFKLKYIQSNFVYGNCHNIAKTLKWDALPGTVPQKMLGISEKSTRLTVLGMLADRCGLYSEE